MQEAISEFLAILVGGLLTAILPALAYFLIDLLRTWIAKLRLGLNEWQRELLDFLAERAVVAAEQLADSGHIQNTAEAKLMEATRRVNMALYKHGITMDEDDIRTHIEASVRELLNVLEIEVFGDGYSDN